MKAVVAEKADTSMPKLLFKTFFIIHINHFDTKVTL